MANKALCLWSLDASLDSQQQSEASVEFICKCTYFLLSPASNALGLAVCLSVCLSVFLTMV